MTNTEIRTEISLRVGADIVRKLINNGINSTGNKLKPKISLV